MPQGQILGYFGAVEALCRGLGVGARLPQAEHRLFKCRQAAWRLCAPVSMSLVLLFALKIDSKEAPKAFREALWHMFQDLITFGGDVQMGNAPSTNSASSASSLRFCILSSKSLSCTKKPLGHLTTGLFMYIVQHDSLSYVYK